MQMRDVYAVPKILEFQKMLTHFELIIRITFKVSSKKTLNRVRPQVWNFNNPPCKTFVREQQ